MVATRNLLLSLAAAVVMSFGLSAAAVAQTTNTAPPPADVTPPPANDPFGEEVTMPELNVVYIEGSGQWENAYETIQTAFKSVTSALEKLGVKPDGSPMTIYTDTNDTGFKFLAALPVKEPPKLPPGSELKVGKSPSGPALKFVHRGSYDAMDTTYEAIADHLEGKKLEAKEQFIEQYTSNFLTTPDDELVINIFVPIKGTSGAGASK